MLRLTNLVLLLCSTSNAVDIVNMRTEYLVSPLGLDVSQPRFSYQMTSEAALRGLAQKSYRIDVYEYGGSTQPVWTSQDVVSSVTHNLQYGVGGSPAAAPLESGGRYSWSVRITTTGGISVESSPSNFTMGFVRSKTSSTGWVAPFIGHNSSNAAPWFRKTFVVGDTTSPAAAGLLYVASIGFCEVSVNGVQVSDVLSPSISYLPSRVLYRTYDVSHLLRPGSSNTIGLWASAGWSNYESFQWANGVQWQTVPLVSAELRYENHVIVKTDATWECRDSNTSHLGNWGSGGFGGDFVNASMDVPDWDTPEMSKSHPWEENAVIYPLASNMTVSADVMEPTKRHSTVGVLNIITTEVNNDGENPGNVTVTMQEVYTGWFEMDDLISLTPNSQIFFYVSTTSGVPSEFSMIDSMTTDENGVGSFRMRFSYHEIHYITIVGLKSTPLRGNIRGFRLSSSIERTGSFTSSSTMMNDIYDTTINNYLGLTTGGQTVDCPHRERRGYGGDAHTSYQFALANFHVGAYFTKWARDFADVQEPSGDVPHTAPTVSGGGGPAWSGFVVTLPWEVYRTYGDTCLLRDMYPTMQKQLAFYRTKTHPSDGLLHAWDSSKWDFLGDWITPHGSEQNVTSPINILFNNCYLHYITSLAADIAQVLSLPNDAKSYRDAASLLADAVNAAFYDQDTGAFVDQLQTHLLMPLATGVVPEDRIDSVVTSLEQAIAKTGGHLDTGLTGNYFMTKFLTETGRNDVLMGMTNKTTFPSYGYFLKQGYTTWPEQWNVDKCCGQEQLSKMHGCYNAIGMWFVQGLVGIGVDYSRKDGYPVIVRAGVDAGTLLWVEGQRSTPQGLVMSSWSILSTGFYHNVTIPGNGVARVSIPGETAKDVKESGKSLSDEEDIKIIGTEEINGVNYIVLGVGAGEYQFSSTWTR